MLHNCAPRSQDAVTLCLWSSLVFIFTEVQVQRHPGVGWCVSSGGRHLGESGRKSSGLKAIIILNFLFVQVRVIWGFCPGNYFGFELFCRAGKGGCEVFCAGKGGSWGPGGVGLATRIPTQQMPRSHEVSPHTSWLSPTQKSQMTHSHEWAHLSSDIEAREGGGSSSTLTHQHSWANANTFYLFQNIILPT